MKISLVDMHQPDAGYLQDIVRVVGNGSDGPEVAVALLVKDRPDEDSRDASAAQRSSLTAFFGGTDPLPADCGMIQAGWVKSQQSLAWAVAETLEIGSTADGRRFIAPIIAAYISQHEYLRAIARAWALASRDDSGDEVKRRYLVLVGSPYYRELLDFSEDVLADLYSHFKQAAAKPRAR